MALNTTNIAIFQNMKDFKISECIFYKIERKMLWIYLITLVRTTYNRMMMGIINNNHNYIEQCHYYIRIL